MLQKLLRRSGLHHPKYLSILLIIFLECAGFGFFKTLHAFSFHSFTTENGLRVWLMPQEQDKTIQIVVHIPTGGKKDPKGKEGLAHFVEHMLFTDNDGRDELEFFKELESHGGKANGFTQREETIYTVAAPAKESTLALDWVQSLLFNHDFNEEAVKKERKIVLLESNLTPLEAVDYFYKIYDYLKIFDKPGFWEREFGFKFDNRDFGGTYHSLHRINKKDIQEFYEKYYGVNGITLFIAGGFEPKKVEQMIRKNFLYDEKLAQMNHNPSPWDEKINLKVRKGYKQRINFNYAGSLGYESYFRIPSPSQNEILMLFFLRDFLREYFNDELRFKDRATYGVSTSLGIYKNAGYFEVSGNFAPEDYKNSRKKIEDALEALKNGSFDPEKFVEYQKRAQNNLKLKTDSPEWRADMFQDYFYNAYIFHSFPDRLAFYENIDFTKVNQFVEKWFTKKNQTLELTFKAPFSKTTSQVIGIVFILWFFVRLRRHWMGKVDLKKLRYLRNFRMPIPQLLVFWLIFVTVYIFYQSAFYFVFDHFKDLYLPINSFIVHFIGDLAVSALWLYFSLLPFTFYPKKFILFTDYFLIKFLTFRSWKIPYENIERVELQRFPGLFDFKNYGITWPLAFGLRKPTIHFKAKGYPALFFSTRRNTEFLEMLAELRNQNAAKNSQASSIQKVGHLGIAVQDIEKAVQFWEKHLGLKRSHLEEVLTDQVKTYFYPVGECEIELLEATGPTSPIQKFLDKKGSGIHHFCLEVQNLPDLLNRLKTAGVQLIDETPRPGAHGYLIAFVHPKSTGGILLELTEMPTK